MNFQMFVEKAGSFLTHRVTVTFSRKTLLHVVNTSMKRFRTDISKLEIKLTQAELWWWHSRHSNKMTTTKLTFLLVVSRKYSILHLFCWPILRQTARTVERLPGLYWTQYSRYFYIVVLHLYFLCSFCSLKHGIFKNVIT